MVRYVIAVKRKARSRVEHDWPLRLRGIEGVAFVGPGEPPIVVVDVIPEALRAVRAALGSDFHIEQRIEHKLSGE